MGLDLTNQLIGVLTRFQQQEVAVMADIEKMYFQILIAGEHRSLLKFLWWKDGDMSKEIIDHKMCVHVFGGVSSGACSDYALRRIQWGSGGNAPENFWPFQLKSWK